MKAQVREVFESLDPVLQEKVRKLNKDIVVRADASTNLKLEDLPGAMQPTGLWDPAGLLKNRQGETIYFAREAELKNGRTAMLATLGIFFADGNHPFYDNGWFGDATTAYASPVLSHHTALMNERFWPALLGICGMLELLAYPDRSKPPGDLGFDPLGLKPKDPKAYMEIQNKELANGRLAMVAWAGIIGQELMLGQKAF